MGIIALVVGQVVGVKDAGHGIPGALVHRGEDSGHTGRLAAVITDGLHRALHGVAGGDRCRQHQHVLILDHWGGVFAEDQLAAGGMLRCDDVDSLVGVHIAVARLGQLAAHAGADDLGAVQAEDGVDNGSAAVAAYQFLGSSAGLG